MTSFPTITHLSQVLEAIKPVQSQFSVVNDNGYLFIKYKENAFGDVFPDYSTAQSDSELLHFKIRRECRGLVFKQSDGRLIVRRYHKFFNVTERSDVSIDRINFNERFVCLDKIDGSLVSPIEHKGKIRFATMMGFTKQATMVDQFVKYLSAIPDQYQYEAFCRYCISKNMSPCFEFVSAMNRIVIKYERTELILIGVRHNESGQYCTYEQLQEWANEYKIPVVKRWDDENIPKTGQDLVEYIRRMQGIEGAVIMFPDSGQIFKCKTLGYSMAHSIHPERMKEREVWRSILENVIDDMVSLIEVDPRIRDALQLFRDVLNAAIRKKSAELSEAICKYAASETAEKVIQNATKHDEVLIGPAFTRFGIPAETESAKLSMNLTQTDVEEFVYDELKKLLLKYMINARRHWTEARDGIYTWLNISLTFLHPFKFENSTGCLIISKKLLQEMPSDQASKYLDLHTKMMSPKKRTEKGKQDPLTAFKRSLLTPEEMEETKQSDYLRVIKTPKHKVSKKKKNKKKK